jgi:hypothetical protein
MLTDVAATKEEDLPAGHNVQLVSPEALYFPAWHETHTLKDPWYPALHLHLSLSLLAAGESAFASQALHVLLAVAPDVAEYLPATQAWQVNMELAPSAAEK